MNMHSSTPHHPYLRGSDIDDEKYPPSEHLLFEPQAYIHHPHHEHTDGSGDQNDEHDDFFFQDDDSLGLRGSLNGIENGLAGLEIKGKVRTLSPVLFHQTHTRYLIINNNALKQLPAEIGHLTNLIYLDLSHNRLKTLPSQIGNLVHLKRLFVDANLLKNLPYELGKLNIDELGLKNNPLGDQILSLFARPNGTREVMNYLREKWKEISSYSKIASYKMSLAWENGDESNGSNGPPSSPLGILSG